MSKERLSAGEIHNEMAAKWLEKEWGIKNVTRVEIWHRTTDDMKDPEFYRQSRLVLSPIDLVDLLDAHVKKATERLDAESQELAEKYSAKYNECIELEDKNEQLQREREWINVEERLPEKGVKVLTCLGPYSLSVDIDFISEYSDENKFHYEPTATHWMPLPEPHKPEK